MSLNCIESLVLNSNERIRIPEGANCMATKRRRCIFSYANPSLKKGYFFIPQGAREVSFPGYKAHGDRHIFYGVPVFYEF